MVGRGANPFLKFALMNGAAMCTPGCHDDFDGRNGAEAQNAIQEMFAMEFPEHHAWIEENQYKEDRMPLDEVEKGLKLAVKELGGV